MVMTIRTDHSLVMSLLEPNSTHQELADERGNLFHNNNFIGSILLTFAKC